jgi:outer membrane cobalamin receptor
MKKWLVLFVVLIPQVVVAQKFTISGTIKDAGSGESLIGANVVNLKNYSGTTSNYYGFYSLTLPSDSINLICTYVGYQPQQVSFVLKKDTVINFNLSAGTYLQEVVVQGQKIEAIQESTQMSSVNVPVAQIKALPALFGEVDVFKVLQLLPGVQSGNEGTSGLYVRGGGPDQNLILLDGVPVYNASHLFGFFSVFNADAINNVELIKGGFPARYGGRLSSVIDINMKEGNMKKFQGEGTIGLIASKMTIEGPIIKDKTSFIVSGRRTYIDLLTMPIVKAVDRNAAAGYYFYDFNAKVNHIISDRDRIYLSAYTGNDKFYGRYRYDYIFDGVESEFKNDFGLQWGNTTSALRWNHVFSPRLFSNFTLTYSRYRFNVYNQYAYSTYNFETQERTKDFYALEYLSGIKDKAVKVDFDWIPNPNHYVRFGASTIAHTFTPGATAIKVSQEVDTTFGADKIRGLEFAAYIEDDIKINSRTKVNLGLHSSGFYVNDVFYPTLQPRVSGRYLLTPDLSVKASYASMTQFIHLLTNSGIGMPTDLWVPVTDNIRPQHSRQVALGFAQSLFRDYEVSIEGYYKNMYNLIEYKEGASFLNVDNNWENLVEIGNGRSYGAEFFLQKKVGDFSGWVGYTLSWTDRQFDNLNWGERFPYKYDRRHDVGIAGVYNFSKEFDFSMAWAYGTGNAISLPISSYFAGEGIGGSVNHYESRNGFRMRPYHRLDLNVSWSKVKRWGVRTWSAGLYNAYNRRNPFFMAVGHDRGGHLKFIQWSLFPVLPSISFSFKF